MFLALLREKVWGTHIDRKEFVTFSARAPLRRICAMTASASFSALE
jgi:hypothetical protein